MRDGEHKTRRLGLKANLPQFILFSVLTLWIGWFLGMERVVVPILASNVFHVSSFILLMSFIASFGFTKAVMNMIGGRLSDRVGRKPVLILGWIFGIPLPFILIFAPNWSWIVIANIMMGINQALTWTMTVTSKVDIVGPNNKGFALGINEFAGYIGQASGGVITGFIAATYGPTPFPFYFGLVAVILGLVFTVSMVKETKGYTRLEMKKTERQTKQSSLFDVFSFAMRNKTFFSCSQAGLIEKFTDTLIWGLYPLFLIGMHVDIMDIALIVGLYLAVWGISQLFTGALADRIGRKPPIVVGMWLMALGILLAVHSVSVSSFYFSSVVIGFGMALVYPVLLTSVSDVADPKYKGSYLGIYRLWRDSGYGFGALVLGFSADIYGIASAFYLSTFVLFVSGILVLVLMKETMPQAHII